MNVTKVADNRYLAPSEVAHRLNLSLSSVYRACEEGTLPHVQLRPGGALRIPASVLQPTGSSPESTATGGRNEELERAKSSAAAAGHKEDQ